MRPNPLRKNANGGKFSGLSSTVRRWGPPVPPTYPPTARGDVLAGGTGFKLKSANGPSPLDKVQKNPVRAVTITASRDGLLAQAAAPELSDVFTGEPGAPLCELARKIQQSLVACRQVDLVVIDDDPIKRILRYSH